MVDKQTVTLIIGGSSGIGLATAQRFNTAGNRLILVGRDAGKLERAAATLREADDIVCWQGDLYSDADIARIRRNIEAWEGGVDQLVNAAGYFKPTGFVDHTGEDYDRYADLNRALFFINPVGGIRYASERCGQYR